MRKHIAALIVVIVGAALLVASVSIAGESKQNLKADDLVGFHENPDISTGATGSFEVSLDDDAQEFTYALSYAGLEGSVLQAHIHFGKRAVNGGIALFLCSNLGNGPAGTPACPPSPATVERTVSAADITGPAGQGINPGVDSYPELAAALRAGHAYANVHSSLWPGGEIRAQINDQNERG